MMEKKLEPNTLFDLKGRVAVITGGAGFLGVKHAEVLAAAGACPVIVDLDDTRARETAYKIEKRFNVKSSGFRTDITKPGEVERLLQDVLALFGRVDILLNNAANNPKVEAVREHPWSRLENFPLEVWNDDINVGLTGAFNCSKVFGARFAEQGKGVIVNVASDLSVIAPDQRLYREESLPADKQSVKPVTYSVVKHGLIGLTKYLATYWADQGVRVNAISPGGVFNGQPEVFVKKIASLIPMGRMANADEYQGAVLFLCSDASSYLTGHNLIADGGRSVW